MSGLNAGANRGLQRSSSRPDLRGGFSEKDSDDGDKPSDASTGGPTSSSVGGFGLRRTTSRPNLLGSGVDLKSLGADTSKNNGGLGMRRTGSKMSLADLVKKDSKAGANKSSGPTPAKFGTGPSADSASSPSRTPQDLAESAVATGDGGIMSPPISPGIPRLHRSRSMNNFESLMEPTVKEGQKAVEQISGKVELPHLDQSPSAQVSSVPTPEHDETTKQDNKADNSSSDKKAESSKPTGQCERPVPAALLHAINHHQPGTSPRDDGSIRPEADSRVDYFSHNWNEADIAGSWRYIISRRQDMANSARLENASWRMWAKAKNNLKTVDPATVNWLKDYDVTWLYGPLYHESEDVYSPRKSLRGSAAGTPDILPDSSSTSRPASDVNSIRSASGSSLRTRGAAGSPRSGSRSGSPSTSGVAPKSILKKKSLAQLMLEEAQDLGESYSQHRASTSKTTANYIRHHHYRPSPQGYNRQVVANILNRQYKSTPSSQISPSHEEGSLSPTSAGPLDSSAAIASLPSKVAAAFGVSPSNSRGNSLSSSLASSRTGSGSQLCVRSRPGSVISMRTSSYASSSGERHVHFNDRVDQCIALDPDEAEAEGNRANLPNVSAESLARHESPLSDSSEDDSDDEDDDDDENDAGGLFLGLRRPSMLDIHVKDEKPHIIAALPATTLKVDEDAEEDIHQQGDIIEAVPSSRRPGFNAQYAPHPVQKYQIVDPEIHAVKFEAKGVKEDTNSNPNADLERPKRRIQPTASFG